MIYNLPKADLIVRRRRFNSCASLCIPSHFSQVVFQSRSYHKTCSLCIFANSGRKEEKKNNSAKKRHVQKFESAWEFTHKVNLRSTNMRICKTSMQVDFAASCDDFMKDTHQNYGVPWGSKGPCFQETQGFPPTKSSHEKSPTWKVSWKEVETTS